jgi:hypothetical protein
MLLLRPTTIQRTTRLFTTSSRSLAGVTSPTESRAIVYAEHGNPAEVLKGHKYQLPALEKGQVRLRFELSAVNPADIVRFLSRRVSVEGSEKLISFERAECGTGSVSFQAGCARGYRRAAAEYYG